MHKQIILLKTKGEGAPKPELGDTPADKRVKGECKTTTYNHWEGEDGRLFCGIWESTPGKIRIDYTEWEFCHFLKGEAILTNEDGESWNLKQGDGFIIPPGFKGTWETVKPVMKQYVILTAKD